jgi:hypothetical protein
MGINPVGETSGDRHCITTPRARFDTRPFPGVHAVPDIMMLALIVLAVLVPAVYAGLCRFI